MRITVVGSINLDIVAAAPSLPAPGETVTGATLSRHPGGKGANQALAARRLGAEVSLIGRVGDDAVALMSASGDALEAVVTLADALRREGVGGAQDFCEFKRIEQVGASSYRVTESCADLRGGDAQTSIVTYELLSERSFKSKSEQGWEHSARFCEQSSMPADWQENDISDVVG